MLLALAEQIGFLSAYVLAATALSLLLGCYLAGAFASRTAGAVSGASFAAVYALLYLLVTSEDYALLAGTLGLFAMLAAAMVLTRKIDWYETAKSTGPGGESLCCGVEVMSGVQRQAACFDDYIAGAHSHCKRNEAHP